MNLLNAFFIKCAATLHIGLHKLPLQFGSEVDAKGAFVLLPGWHHWEVTQSEVSWEVSGH